MDQKTTNAFSHQARKQTRRGVLVKASFVAGAAALGITGTGIALRATHAASDSSSLTPVAFYRLLKAKDHFYTTNAEDKGKAVAQLGYTYEGIAGYIYPAQASNTVAVHRLRNSFEHFYTADPNEVTSAQKQHGYSYEGIAGYAYVAPQSLVGSAIPKGYTVASFFRLNSPNGHFYTANASEMQNAEKQGGFYCEGLAFFIFEAV
jgi:hypothetical protein